MFRNSVGSTSAEVSEDGKKLSFIIYWNGDIPDRIDMENQFSKCKHEMRAKNIYYREDTRELYFDGHQSIKVCFKLYPKF
jgi:hypothetical protein